MKRERTICIFGASTTWGAWDLEKGGWANRLRLYFDSLSDEQWQAVYALAIHGNTTADVLKRFDIEVEARQPSMIIFSLGDNDSAWDSSENTYRVPIDDFKENIAELIKRAKKYTPNILVQGLKKVDESLTTPIPWRKELSYTNEALRQYDQVLREVANLEKVKYVPIFGMLDNNDLDDGLHPNTRGHEKLFNIMRDEILKFD